MPITSLARRLRVPALLLATTALLLTGCGSTTDTAVEDGVRVVSPSDAADLIAAEPAPTIIDVRTPAEYAEGHLGGAVLVDYNAADFRTRIAELPRDGDYVIYCRSGNRSAGARAIMAELGFDSVADIEGGILAWTAAGLPVTTT